MIQPVIEVTPGTELPDWTFAWRDSAKKLIDFSAGYTLTITIQTPTPIVKSSGITGLAVPDPDADVPNVSAAFAAGELDGLPAGLAVYEARLDARRTADNKDREPFRFRVLVPES